jgi:hypothetical protein
MIRHDSGPMKALSSTITDLEIVAPVLTFTLFPMMHSPVVLQ